MQVLIKELQYNGQLTGNASKIQVNRSEATFLASKDIFSIFIINT